MTEYNYIKHNALMKKIIKKTLIILTWLIIWQLLALSVNISFIFPGPLDVMQALVGLIKTQEYYRIITASTLRIAVGFVISFMLGIISGRFGIIREFIEPVMQLFKTVPVTAFIILVLIWFNSQNAATIISFIITLPMIYSGTLSGITDCDIKLIQMSQVFRLGILRRLRYIYVPQVYPYIISSLKVAVGMCFKAGISAEVIGLILHPDITGKAGISAEVIGLTKDSIGSQMYYSKLYIMTADLFAWSITVVVVSFIVEKLCIFVIELLKRLCTGTLKV